MDRYNFLIHPEEFQNPKIEPDLSPEVSLSIKSPKGPASQNLIIRGPNGEGLIIPERNLIFNFENDGDRVRFSIVLSQNDANILKGSLGD